MTEELLAQIVEEVSMLVTEPRMAREKPRHVMRPKFIEDGLAAQKAVAAKAEAADRTDQPTVNADGSVVAVGHRQLLTLMQSRGAIQHSGAPS